eukprot:UN29188
MYEPNYSMDKNYDYFVAVKTIDSDHMYTYAEQFLRGERKHLMWGIILQAVGLTLLGVLIVLSLYVGIRYVMLAIPLLFCILMCVGFFLTVNGFELFVVTTILLMCSLSFSVDYISHIMVAHLHSGSVAEHAVDLVAGSVLKGAISTVIVTVVLFGSTSVAYRELQVGDR